MTERRPDATRLAYRGAASRWERDASIVYVPLARHLIGQAPVELAGCVVLDAGAGTGAASDLLRAEGARVVALDLEPSMLELERDRRAPGVLGDITTLPFRARSFDVVVAAFVLNHVARADVGLRELARVTKRGGVVLASTFSGRRASAKSAFDVVATAYGWTAPDWYVSIRARQSGIDDSARLVAAARRAGLNSSVVTEQSLDIGVADPAAVVRYRLGMPQYTRFVGRLGDARMAEFVDEATAAVTLEGPFRPEVVELVARIT